MHIHAAFQAFKNKKKIIIHIASTKEKVNVV